MTGARTRRLVVTGSEGTGKTTLSLQLAERLEGRCVGEYARTYAERAARPLTAEDVEPIARGQMAAEDAAAHGGPALLVLDTDLVSTVAYARHYYGACPAWIVDEAARRLGDLYLLCDTDVPWVADGVRDRPLERSRIHERFRETLRELGARVVEVRGTPDERLTTGVEAARTAGLAAR
jgi:NadR type nicotinamide-nucleotide adenylyltransferase